MRHLRVLRITLFAVLAVAFGGRAALAQFNPADWLLHRGTPTRLGRNADPGLAGNRLGRTWVWPATRDLPAEIVADNNDITAVPSPMFPVGGWDAAIVGGTVPNPVPRLFGIKAPAASPWVYPAVADRQTGAWPVVAPDTQPNKQGDYIYNFAQKSNLLAAIGVSRLSQLPNMGTGTKEQDPLDPTQQVILYRRIHEELLTSPACARWAFGTFYPTGTLQGKRDVSSQPLNPGQRYAVYIKFPTSGTFVGVGAGRVAHPNVDHAMVRVSWGNDPDDPITSRIFIVNFGQTGGTWVRIRSASETGGQADDRYFPYDGIHPITVTLYNLTPDDVDDTTQFFAKPIVVADAVRLVPEAMRGDIHASAASAVLPAGDPTRSVRRTYFGRDETTGPRNPRTLPEALASPPGPFTPIPFNPILPYDAATNPNIGDPTSSVRSAVFYCFEDRQDADPTLAHYGKLIWRYVSQSAPIRTTTIDDITGVGTGFAATAGFLAVPGAVGVDQSYGTTYHRTLASASPATENATWAKGLPGTAGTTSYSVFVWIPGGNDAIQYAHKAHYQVYTTSGPVDVYLDQRNTDDSMPGAPRTGGWRRLISGVHFPGGVDLDGNTVPILGKVVVYNDSADDAAANRYVVADAAQFVAESQAPNSVVASPLVAHVAWPSGTVRDVVYFATTDGHLWALDAQGVGGGSTLTTCYWVYPSITNPDPTAPATTITDTDKSGDPNYNPDDAARAGGGYGIDGDTVPAVQAGVTPPFGYKIERAIPLPGSFRSSPVYVEVERSGKRFGYIVIGGQNGRIYAFDPAGRVNPATNEPFAATIAAGPDTPGIPGTTRRLMTWPSLARDKWNSKSDSVGNFGRYADDPHKTVFASSPTADLDGVGRTTKVIAGAGDGHVYALDMVSLDWRISNSINNGQPLWQYPASTTQLNPILLPGALTATGKFIFSAGGRVYAIHVPAAAGQPVAALDWVFPFTALPPGNPNPGDQAPNENLFTAPVWVDTVAGGLNAGKEVVFVANRDGTVTALDASPVAGAGPSATTVLWQSRSFGTTRASAVYLNSLTPNPQFRPLNAAPAILLPNDAGEIIAVTALQGRAMWGFADGAVGEVPLDISDTTGAPQVATFTTTNTWRGADAITANQWVYQGDEGNQDIGEMNGQMRAYAIDTVGLVTPDEPNPDLTQAGLSDVRLVDLFNTSAEDPANGHFDFYGLPTAAPGQSPYNDYIAGNTRKNTQGNVSVYEWGDTLNVAAWGAFTGDVPPQVTFRLITGSTTRPPYTVGAVLDRGYTGPPLKIIDPLTGAPVDARPWVAKYSIPFGRGSEADSQAPGGRYQVNAQAQGRNGFISSPLSAGQAYPPAELIVPDPTKDYTNDLAAPRQIALAHPFALTARSVPPVSGPSVGPTVFNIIGWTNRVPIDDKTTDLTEIFANGNRLVDAATLTVSTAKDVAAPVGMISHGASGVYLGVDTGGNRVPALFVADRSNLYKTGQPLNDVHVERREARWGWNPDMIDPTGIRKATGNVMNPLPWETFPNNTPNTSPDYPDVDRSRMAFRVGGVDMAQRGINLLPPDITTSPGNKILRPVQIDLQVDVPTYQPANVSTDYRDINGALNPGLTNGLMAPMVVDTGRDASTLPAISGLTAPSAGYLGSVVVYQDSNHDSNYQGSAFLDNTLAGLTTGREEVYRRMTVGFTVQPDLRIRTEEETVDIGNVPHALGFTPNVPFAPTGIGPYSAIVSPWETAGGPLYFLPFTVKNHGNVNLINLRVAKLAGDFRPAPQGGNFSPDDPTFWFRMTSDQVENFAPTLGQSVGSIWSRPYNVLGAPAAGNFGIVTSLDHSKSVDYASGPRSAGPFGIEKDYSAAPYSSTNFWPSANPYVLAGNPLALAGWPGNTQPRPTLHKARAGDTAPTTFSMPDVPYGDPFSVLPGLNRDVRAKIGVAVPLGTPAGTYSMPVYTFEDAQPGQWREWIARYKSISGGTGTQSAIEAAIDDDGILNFQGSARGLVGPPVEAAANPTFNLKATVREARLTNALSVLPPGIPLALQTDGDFPQIDLRLPSASRPNNEAFGANIQPFALQDRGVSSVGFPGNILLYWASNRPNAFGPSPTTPDTTWSLFFSQLNAVSDVLAPKTPYSPFFDWAYANPTQWWNPLAAAAAYPDTTLAPIEKLFPSEASQVTYPDTPVVPGVIIPNSVRHATVALAQDDDPAKVKPDTWAVWQGAAYKNTGAGAQSYALDSRTFFAPLKDGVPNPPGNIPYSLLNDPSLPKFAPRPIILTTTGSQTRTYLFWYSGGRGRTRLYYNVNDGDLTDATKWLRDPNGSRDFVLTTPDAFSALSDPIPIHRLILSDDRTQLFDAIDVVYTGVLRGRTQAETVLTRYIITPNGRLTPVPLPRAQNELLVRSGISHTWYSRDIAWVFRDPQTRRLDVDQAGNPLYVIRVNGTRVNVGTPTFDAASGKVYFDCGPGGPNPGSGAAFSGGGQITIDPQSGAVTFLSVAPRPTDIVTASYRAQSLRVNVTRNESGAETIPAGWGADAGFQLRGHILASGSNAHPVAFLDRGPNPRWTNPAQDPAFVFLPADPAVSSAAPKYDITRVAPPTTRHWTLYRKSDSDTAPAGVYYKTMRLMVRLPRGVLRDYSVDPTTGIGQYRVTNHVRIQGNVGPVEIDWVRGRLYFTEADEGSLVNVSFDYARDAGGGTLTVPATQYRVGWGDEITTAIKPGDQTTHEVALPTTAMVNEGQISAFKDAFLDKVWVFWASTRSGTTDLFYMTLSPQFYAQPGN